MKISVAALCGLVWLLACADVPEDARPGALTLGLTTEAGGASYRLVHARFALEGPVSQALVADGEPDLTVELAPGEYTLTLLPGWGLERFEGSDAGVEGAAVSARLVSQNPLEVSITPGGSSEALWRFELLEPNHAAASGRLTVGLEVETDGGPAPAPCGFLRISEVDYEQEGPDDGEFVELVNAGTCELSLEGAALELVNGGNGSVYARYELIEAGDSLLPGERMLVADEALPASARGKFVALRGSGLQNGPDGVRLVRGEEILDAFAYEGDVTGAGEGTPSPGDVGPGSLSRCPRDLDGDDNALDFKLTLPTPLAENACD